MIKAVFFDIDNTLYSYDRAHETAMEALLLFGEQKLSLTPEVMESMIIRTQESIIDRLGTNCAAIHDRLIRFQCFLETLQYPDMTMALEMNRVYEEAFLESMVPEPGIYSFLQILQKTPVILGIGSDQNALAQYHKLKRIGILNYFSRIVTSEEAGAEKPSVSFFRLCLEKAGCHPEECVFIGDNIKKDVEGALQNGLRGVWYCPKETLESHPDYPMIHSYEDCLETWEKRFSM